MRHAYADTYANGYGHPDFHANCDANGDSDADSDGYNYTKTFADGAAASHAGAPPVMIWLATTAAKKWVEVVRAKL